MWKSIMNTVVESFAMCDPVAYMYYLNARREAELEADVTPYRAPIHQPLLRPIDGKLPARNQVSA